MKQSVTVYMRMRKKFDIWGEKKLICFLYRALDEKIDTSFKSVHQILSYSQRLTNFAWHKDWKRGQTANLALSKDLKHPPAQAH